MLKHIPITTQKIIDMALCAAMLFIFSCTDDTFNPHKFGKYIVFSIKDGDKALATTKSGGMADRYCATAALLSGEDTLYLSSYSTMGIDVTNLKATPTRGKQANSETLTAFGIYGILTATGKEYIRNAPVSNEGEYWTPDKDYLWPGNSSVKFHAYAPYVDAPSTEGITSLPAYNDLGNFSLDYKVPSKIEDQIDLMWGKPITTSISPCEIDLHHALTAIRFVTGREMAPSVIKSISISGVKFKGSLNLETGDWSLNDETTSYTLECNKELKRGTDEFVAPNTPLAGTPDDNLTLLLMPQELGEDAKITLIMEWGKEEHTFESSLKDKQWCAGTTLTYRLSANPGIPILRLEVIDTETGLPLTEITPGWKGGKKIYKIVSNYDPATGADVVPIPWEATLIAPDGHEITQEELTTGKYHNIDYYDVSGEGDKEDCRLITILPEPTFNGPQSAATESLRSAKSVGSKDEPYNLASRPIHQGDIHDSNEDYNTSNCYTVNNPGRYCLPLVYGNAIVDGVYRPETHSGDKFEIPKGGLKNFINHLGNAINSAYIYDHAGCKPEGAKLLWTDQINVIRDVKLETFGGKPMLTFNVPATSIRQCNAVVAVTDKDGVVMWSWHIWVTSMKTNSQDEYIPINHTDNTGPHKHYLYHTNIGHIYAGDNVHFKSHPLTIKYRQQLPESLAESRMNPKEWEVILQEADEDVSPIDYFLLYQWGRKDPFVPSIEKYYDENHNAIPVGKDTDVIRLTEGEVNIQRLISEGIKRPMANWISLKNSNNFDENFSVYNNLWNIEGASDEHGNEYHCPYKSVYDPSPVGCKLPIGAVLELLVEMPYRWVTHYGSSDVPAGVFTIDKDSKLELFIFAAGYRDPAGNYNNTDEGYVALRKWFIWEGTLHQNTSGKAINGHKGGVTKTGYVFTSSLGVRPMHVEGSFY